MNSTLKRFSFIFCALVIMVSLFALPKVYEFTVGNKIAPQCVIQPFWADHQNENFFFSKVEIHTYVFEVFLCAILAWLLTIAKEMIIIRKRDILTKADNSKTDPERNWDQS